MSIEKLLMKNCWDKKERSFNFLSFEEKRTNFGAGKSKLWQFEVPGGGGGLLRGKKDRDDRRKS